MSRTAFYLEFVLNRLDLACSDLSGLVQACLDLSRHVQTCPEISNINISLCFSSDVV